MRLRRALVGFDAKLQDWDGFGVDLEASQTRDYQVTYYFFRQVCRTGQPCLAVAKLLSNDSEICLIAFAKKVSPNPDVFCADNRVRRKAAPGR